MRRWKALLRQRRGVTLVELMAASALMCVMLGMAAACIHPAAAALQRTRQLHDARLILDTVLTQVRMEVEGSCGWIRLAPREDETLPADAVTFLDSAGAEITMDAASCRAQFAPAFFMGMELELLFSPEEGAAAGERAETLLVTATLYRDESRTEAVDTQWTAVCLRHEPLWAASPRP